MEIARYFTFLGFTAFGGPAAHVALMEEELVHRRHWLEPQHFLDLLATINFVPGPNSTELAIGLGRLRGGVRGLIVAGICFILPAVLIILPIGWVYVRFHHLSRFNGFMHGASAAVVAIVAVAAMRFAQSTIKDPLGAMIALLAAMGELLNHRLGLGWMDVAILGAAGVVGALRAGPSVRLRSMAMAPLAAIFGAAAGGVTMPVLMALIFLKIGATLFGSGYLLVTYLQDSFVDHHHWLTSQQVLDAVTVGQVTPGPLLTTATFIGFILGYDNFGGGLVGGVVCGVIATAAIFAPAFIIIGIFGGWLERLRMLPGARGALNAMNAAVVGLIGATCVALGRQALSGPWRLLSMILIGAALVILLRTRINATYVLVGAGLLGLLY